MFGWSEAIPPPLNKTIHFPSEIQVPVGCGEVAVFPGDIIVGDSEGVVVIPAHLADDVADAAEAQELKEDFILEKIRAGASLVGTYPPDEKRLAQYEAWCHDR